MAHLTIDGHDIDVQENGAQRSENFEIGKRITRAFSGNARSSVRTRKRVWEFTTGPMANADVATLRTAVDGGQFVNCAGAFLGGTISCSVIVAGEEFVSDLSQPTSYLSVLRLRLEEA